MVNRNKFIDNLRGFAILVMILTHVTVFFSSDKLATAIWNWSHFSVPIFVFCSAYLFLQKNLNKPIGILSYARSRLSRLLIPYYVFLLFFIPTIFILTPEKVSIKYILQSFLVTGGVDINWLVLIFLYLSVLFPLFVLLFQKYKVLFWAGFVVSLLSTVYFLFQPSPVPYKYIMWIPWSLIIYGAFFYQRYEQATNKFFIAFFVMLIVFLSAYFIRDASNHSVVLIHNKYPPNILYLSYGISVFLLLTLLLRTFSLHRMVTQVLHYFSVLSYPLYFIHYTILTIFVAFLPQLKFNWFTFFIVVLSSTVVVQQMLFLIQKKFAIKKHRGNGTEANR